MRQKQLSILFLTALYVSSILQDLSPTAASTHNELLNAGIILTLALTLWTTLLITYRIYSVSRHNPSHSKARFQNILRILTQSAGIYSVALLANVPLLGIVPNQSNVWTIFTAGNYLGVILHVMTVCILFVSVDFQERR